MVVQGSGASTSILLNWYVRTRTYPYNSGVTIHHIRLARLKPTTRLSVDRQSPPRMYGLILFSRNRRSKNFFGRTKNAFNNKNIRSCAKRLRADGTKWWKRKQNFERLQLLKKTSNGNKQYMEIKLRLCSFTYYNYLNF